MSRIDFKHLLAICLTAGLLFAATASSAQAVDFTNPQTISVPVSGTTIGAASPYPSTITVSGLTPPVTWVALTLALTHGCPQDLDVLLVGPDGQRLLALSDSGGCPSAGQGRTWTFDDFATGGLPNPSFPEPAPPTGAYLPTNVQSDLDVFPPPAPRAPYASSLSVFNDSDPNGDWRLFVFDDGIRDTGSISGWTLSIESGPDSQPPRPPAFGANIDVSFPARSLRASRRGRVKLPVRNGNGFPVGGKVTLTSTRRFRTTGGRRQRLGFGSRSFTVPARTTSRVSLRIPRRNLALLRSLRRMRMRATASVRDPAGASRTISRSLTLKAPRSKRR